MFSAVGKHWGWRTSLGAQDFGDPAALVLLHLFFFFHPKSDEFFVFHEFFQAL